MRFRLSNILLVGKTVQPSWYLHSLEFQCSVYSSFPLQFLASIDSAWSWCHWHLIIKKMHFCNTPVQILKWKNLWKSSLKNVTYLLSIQSSSLQDPHSRIYHYFYSNLYGRALRGLVGVKKSERPYWRTHKIPPKLNKLRKTFKNENNPD